MSKIGIVIFLRKHYFSAILILFFFYSLLLIFRSSFIDEGTRYFSLFDDMMISMRYAYNLAHGSGLVWNPSFEKVEGFSNPLWTLYMAFVHLLPLPIEKASFVMQITGLLALLGNLYFVKAITEMLTRGSRFAVIVALILTAFYFPLNNWSIIQGTEVSLLTLLLTAATYFVIRSLINHKLSLLLFVLMGIGTLVRLDFTASAITLIVILLLYSPKYRKKIIFQGIPLFLFFILAQVGLRWWYYQDILPNTYYLKMTGYPVVQRITRGIYFTIRELNLVVVLLPFLYAFLTKNRNILILLAVFSTQIFYSMYVGADAWEQFGGANRYVAIAIPLFFISLAISINAIRKIVRKKRLVNFGRYIKAEFLFIIFLVILFNSASDNMLLYLTQIKSFPTKSENIFQVNLAQNLNQITQPDAKIGIVQAGVVPYFSPNRTYIDLLGRSEKVIAHGTSHELGDSHRPLQRYLSFWPGHTKWDYTYVITKLEPDVFGQVFPETELSYLQKDYKKIITDKGYTFYLRSGSKKLKI